MLNSMDYSVIQGSYELNKAFIIENFCVNKDKPMMNCDGKCYLADKMRAQKEKQDTNSVHKFSSDFGIYIPIPKLESIYSKSFVSASMLVVAYLEPFTSLLVREVVKPPRL